MAFLDKLKNLFPFGKKKKKQEDDNEDEDAVEVPSEWVENEQGIESPREEEDDSPRYIVTTDHGRKLRIPWLHGFKRISAALLMIFNFFIAQITFFSPTPSIWVFLLFLANALLLADYLWKTRKGA